MTLKKALVILGLNTPYTEEELKKAYRTLIVLTHPDSVKAHDYEYEASDINAAYEYLLSHKPSMSDAVSVNKKTLHQNETPKWNADTNSNAYVEREIYHEVESSNGDVLGIVIIAKGKYIWSADEDFSLFLRSIYNCSKQMILDVDEKMGRDRSLDIALQGDIAYLLAQQYVDTQMILSLTEYVGVDSDSLPIYKIKGMLERTAYDAELMAGEVLFPAGVKNHRLYVKNKDRVVGYVSFKDDRLYYGIIPLFERKAVQVKMKLIKAKKANSFYDIEMVIKHLKEDKFTMIESINNQIDSLLYGR